MRVLIISTLAIFFAFPAATGAAIFSEISISRDGVATAKSLKVMQIAGTTMFVRAYWDEIFIRLAVLTNDKTTIEKKHGEKATAVDFKEGDLIDVEGFLPTGGNSLNIQAKFVRNTSLLRESKNFSGTIKSIDVGNSSFVLIKNDGATVTVRVSGASIKKGVRTINFSELAKGNRVLSAEGTYDYSTNVLETSSLEIYQDKSVFEKKNYSGTVVRISSESPPTITARGKSGKELTLYLSEKTEIISKDRKKTALSRFEAGDAIRFYGGIRPTNLYEVDIEVVRNMTF